MPYLRQAGIILSLTLVFTLCAHSEPILDFEGFSDSTVLTTQYSGLMFSNAIILSAGISLNEFEFPPRSGVNVASDDGGPMSIAFAAPVLNFGGYFTYGVPVALEAFDASDNLVASLTSAFSNNEALSGDPGSIPNELLYVSFPGGIAFVTILGDPIGGSFTLDDANYTPISTPEPATISLLAAGILTLFSRRFTKY